MNKIVQVLIPPLKKPLSYKTPVGMSKLKPGYRVIVPLGPRKVTGFVINDQSVKGTSSRPNAQQPNRSEKSFEIKSIISAPENDVCFREDQIAFFQSIADYYGEPLSTVLDAAVPPSVPPKYTKRVSLLKESSSESRSRKRKDILRDLASSGGPLSYSLLLKKYKGAGPILKKLAEEKIVRITKHEEKDSHVDKSSPPSWASQDIKLNREQKQAISQISPLLGNRSFKTFLLYGVTGSGKTEVYIELIERALKLGLGALVIVPEISLTPQLIDRFRARLGNELAVLHSGLSKRSRWDSWQALLQGRNRVAIGARSAVFAPVTDLGLIVVDEEHDSSFKQSDGLRYNGRDVAVLRGKLCSCPVVLGSATPSLETFYRAKTGPYHLLSLPHRHGAREPEIELIDMNRVKPKEMPSKNISPRLYELLESVIERDEQAFLLYNRRGFASYYQCTKCFSVEECKNCSVTLTYHQDRNVLLCHYCGYTRIPPEHCRECEKIDPGCTPGKLVRRGAGTEKVYEELQALFPETVIDRLDRDTASKIESFRAILQRVRSGETRILVGTQMIAKGHDLPGVTLVGIIDCDVGLHIPDFRGGEKVFQLLTQAAGRAGRRNRLGRVVCQTRVPTHPSLVRTQRRDFEGFALSALKKRQELLYPPYSRLLRVIVTSLDKELAFSTVSDMRKYASAAVVNSSPAVSVIGPAPAPIQRLKGKWRWHLLLKSKSPSSLNRVMQIMKNHLPGSGRVKVFFDIDPQEML